MKPRLRKSIFDPPISRTGENEIKKRRLVCPVEWNPSHLQDPASQRFLYHAVFIPHKYDVKVILGMGEAIWLHNTLPSGTIVLLMNDFPSHSF